MAKRTRCEAVEGTDIPAEVREALNWAWVTLGWVVSERHRRIVLDYIDALLELVPIRRE